MEREREEEIYKWKIERDREILAKPDRERRRDIVAKRDIEK